MADKWSDRLLRTRAQVQTLMAGAGLNYPGFFQISNAVGATKQVLVWAKSASTISSFAVNITDDTIGIYDIGADTFSITEANHNLGQNEEKYTPTCTTIVGTGTMTPLSQAKSILIDNNSVSLTFAFRIDLGGGETDGTFTFTLPPSFLPANNFAANDDLQFIVGLPNAAQWNSNDVIGYNATVGAKTGSISYQSATAGDTKKITIFARYNIN